MLFKFSRYWNYILIDTIPSNTPLRDIITYIPAQQNSLAFIGVDPWEYLEYPRMWDAAQDIKTNIPTAIEIEKEIEKVMPDWKSNADNLPQIQEFISCFNIKTIKTICLSEKIDYRGCRTEEAKQKKRDSSLKRLKEKTKEYKRVRYHSHFSDFFTKVEAALKKIIPVHTLTRQTVDSATEFIEYNPDICLEEETKELFNYTKELSNISAHIEELRQKSKDIYIKKAALQNKVLLRDFEEELAKETDFASQQFLKEIIEIIKKDTEKGFNRLLTGRKPYGSM